MLVTNEIYGPVKQGEGKSSGLDVMFLRLSGCNLACVWCFVSSTKITTPNGPKRIKDISVGDLVLSSDTKIIVPKKVTKIFLREVTKDELVKIQVKRENVERIDTENCRVFCTMNHEFFTSEGWKQANQLQLGDEIEYIDTINWHMKNRNPSSTPEGRRRVAKMARKANLGRRASCLTRGRLRESKLGPKNPRYTGIRAENLPGYYENWWRIREDILERDRYKCQCCGATERLEIHHIIPFRISKSHDYSNLITLCKFCHLQAERQFLHNGKKVVSVTPVTTWQAAQFNDDSKSIKVFNLEVEDFHTYFANSLLVHNCDTAYTWNWLGTKFLHPDKYDPKLEVHKMTSKTTKEILYEKAGSVRSLVISGGEPMLQQERLIELLQDLKKDSWWIEIETNGTIIPTDQFISLINQFNCSPKTSNSGPDNPPEDRLNNEALKKISSCGEKATFKFVIQSLQDIEEMEEIIKNAGIKPEQVWLMPEGRTREEQLERQNMVWQVAARHKYNYSPRLHILEFDNKRGV